MAYLYVHLASSKTIWSIIKVRFAYNQCSSKHTARKLGNSTLTSRLFCKDLTSYVAILFVRPRAAM